MKTTECHLAFAPGVLSLLPGCSVIPEYPSHASPLVRSETKRGAGRLIAGHDPDNNGEAFMINHKSNGTASRSQLVTDNYSSRTNPAGAIVFGPQAGQSFRKAAGQDSRFIAI
jgi:hypothetical protein